MKKISLIIMIASLPILSHAQLGGLIKKAKDKVAGKVNQRVDQKADQAIEKELDKIEGKDRPKQEVEAVDNAASPKEVETVKTSTIPASYTRFDFVAGEKVIYSNDFSEETLGELPVGWNSNGNGAVVTIDGQPGNWLQLYKDAFYLTDNKSFFTENFTVEFDIILRRTNPKASFPQLGFGVMATPKDSTAHNQSIKDYRKFFAAELKLQPSDYEGSHMHYESFENYNRYLNTDIKKYPALEKYFNTPIHIAIQVQKERLRIWFNESKMYDLPKAIKQGVPINQFFLFMKGNGGNEEEVGYVLSNIKVANGVADTRHKLINEGKFSTTGILFAVNSSVIKPESFGVLKEIADVLLQYPDMKVKVVGHTDSDGSDDANLLLSRKRAEAVQQALLSQFKIDAGRIEFSGKGEREPVGDNKTKEGKAQNRRVEFIKI